MLTGKQIKELQQALLSAYPTRAKLRQMIRVELDQHLTRIAGGEDLSDIVFNLIGWAESEGRLKELIQKSHAYKVGNAQLSAFASEYQIDQDKQKRVRTDSVAVPSSGDTITATISGVGAGAQVAVGKQIRQTITQAPSRQSVSDLAEISHLFAKLKSELAGLELAEHKKIIATEFVEQLEEELSKKEQQPDGSVIKVAGNWLLKNIPALTSTLAAIFLSPVVGKVVEAAGDIAADWVKERFGG